jgi:hypothetical protein
MLSERTWLRVIGCGLLLSGLSLQACGDDDDNVDSGLDGGPDSGQSGSGSSGNGGSGAKDAGGDGSVFMPRDAGTKPPPPPVKCGDTTCAMPAAQAAMLGVTACCQDNGDCGIQTPLAPGCLPPAAPGGVDSSCPNFEIMGGLLKWFGCCTPDGECGGLDTSMGGEGCVANSNLMQPEQSCSYDPTNTCQRIIDVQCDGAEDCKTGQKCCGDFDSGYRKFVCADDCAAEQTDQGGMWAAACHPGEECAETEANPAITCKANTDYLPGFLFRCKDTGTEPTEDEAGSTKRNEINCGDTVCGKGTKCCISIPSNLTKCVDKDVECPCESGIEGDGGTEDAGN